MTDRRKCGWCIGDPLYERYHDEEWGVPLYESRGLFEFLLLEGAQAGLSWITVLRKREHYRAAFDGFDPEKIARYDDSKKQALMMDSGIIRNRLKIDSAITNARVCIEMGEEPFVDLLWSFVGHEPRQNRYRSLEEVPASTDESREMSRVLRKHGFRFVGETICYAFMQATGMVNDHLVTCYRHSECGQ